jgi:hypothetical protein
MGFKFEGVLRWDRVMPGDRRDLGEAMLRRGDLMPGTLRRDSAILAMCWDDWGERRCWGGWIGGFERARL